MTDLIEDMSGYHIRHGYVGINEYLDAVWGFWFSGSIPEPFTSTREIDDFKKPAIEYFVDTCLAEDQPWSLDAPTDLALEFWVFAGAFSKSGL